MLSDFEEEDEERLVPDQDADEESDSDETIPAVSYHPSNGF